MIELALLAFMFAAMFQGTWYIAGACALVLAGVEVLRT
jgi:hypothetical protein